ncbi:MAG: hypothetical protein HGA29_06695, partial [Syntrophaceae bacterium]|nr:hypothetical protein [Syntrophaceae bacterium]
ENLSSNVLLAQVRAAAELGTCIVLPANHIPADAKKYSKNIIPLIAAKEIDKHQSLIKGARIVALEYTEDLLGTFSALKDKIKKTGNVLTLIRVPATKSVENIVSKLAQNGAEIIHVVADYRGMEVGGSGKENHRLGKDIIRAVHLKLVEDRIRDEVTIIFSGGIAMAEHVPKAMICGADLVAVDLPLLIALGARMYEDPEKIIVLPEGLDKIQVRTLMRRMVNLMGAWHSQLLEVMGAMGIREARRLRGETGRAIFFEEIDNDTFGKIFKKREKTNV